MLTLIPIAPHPQKTEKAEGEVGMLGPCSFQSFGASSAGSLPAMGGKEFPDQDALNF